ncbi:MAG: hypothetical protein CME70_10605 [Halobacteriovorax sp.]|nr:hypothetical protein [Halobacteriovorax sp.]|tara:strand:+ start:101937 stop:102419 length:483 start_codon:yes stop_codon:yes gene_type:complete
MDFSRGDLVAGVGISAGEYVGKEVVSAYGKTEKFHKVIEEDKDLIHYLPCNEDISLRKLPTKRTLMRYLRDLKSSKMIDVGEIEGSRYRYFKNKFLKGSLKPMLEVFHDLNILKKEKKISVSERKLFNELKEKLVIEASYILDQKQDHSEHLLENIGITT